MLSVYGAAQFHRLRQIRVQVEGARKELDRLRDKADKWPTVEQQELLLSTMVAKGEFLHYSAKPHIIAAQQALAANPKALVRIGEFWSGRSIDALNAWAVDNAYNRTNSTRLETFLVLQVPQPQEQV
jgi:hypothetical protein